MERILVTGANGQVGSDLVVALRRHYGVDRVVGADLSLPADKPEGPHEVLDVVDREGLQRIADRYAVDSIFHLASLLSARGEKQPDLAWQVNMEGLKHVLDEAALRSWQVFWPSSIAVFGANTPKDRAPQATVLEPATMYGITKCAGELLCKYYHARFDVDIRSLRYPGLISYSAPPGGGTTDYAIDMLLAAVEGTPNTCFVRPETRLPMMYMPDAVQAALDLMEAPAADLTVHTSYNIEAISFSAEELESEIKKAVPGFQCTYEPDFRQKIAETWPSTIDDSCARKDWNWRPGYDLASMVEEMLEHLRVRVHSDS
jgi:nucleoside-diphosphate-sugar epimerase